MRSSRVDCWLLSGFLLISLNVVQSVRVDANHEPGCNAPDDIKSALNIPPRSQCISSSTGVEASGSTPLNKIEFPNDLDFHPNVKNPRTRSRPRFSDPNHFAVAASQIVEPANLTPPLTSFRNFNPTVHGRVMSPITPNFPIVFIPRTYGRETADMAPHLQLLRAFGPNASFNYPVRFYQRTHMNQGTHRYMQPDLTKFCGNKMDQKQSRHRGQVIDYFPDINIHGTNHVYPAPKEVLLQDDNWIGHRAFGVDNIMTVGPVFYKSSTLNPKSEPFVPGAPR
ncbi:hypothetical protein PGT21_024285 [Puccinia graminis f. sp. tritici]|uniref:Uncharacterized protein n=1 Tax=Puccinia graminis f. sp. tritici TaxID=56615 RepID=A0A5B0N6M7_PUCGR|nr:hypothetical protein PGT21_024285 [Puccinia graminis f. sp. tritici]KAA1092296.1 hypothetical protein PGTUg99_015771 [Puccinia graminis f. sp. tritici]